MHRFLSAALAFSLAATLSTGIVDAKTCRDASGKFTKCPASSTMKSSSMKSSSMAPSSSMKSSSMKSSTSMKKAPCRDPKTGKFTKCAK